MPFAYYGAKHGLADKYPAPRHPLVVEPFAGSAGYSTFHAARLERVVLYDIDPKVVDLWHELQSMTVADIDLIGVQLEQEKFTHPLLAGMAGGTTMAAVLAGKSRIVTPRMRHDWRNVRRRIVATLPHLNRWEIHHGTYHDAPDIEATWHVDPPYQSTTSHAGLGYRHGDGAIDFTELAAWVRTRRGFVMVCERSPATWLPFAPFAAQGNGASNDSRRVEVIWRSDMEVPTLWDQS